VTRVGSEVKSGVVLIIWQVYMRLLHQERSYRKNLSVIASPVGSEGVQPTPVTGKKDEHGCGKEKNRKRK